MGVCMGGHDYRKCLYGVGGVTSVSVHQLMCICIGNIYGCLHSCCCLSGVAGGGYVHGSVYGRP